MDTASTSEIAEYKFLQGGGEMGKLTRNFDWSKTSLGTPDSWAYGLRVSVSNMLHTSLPMLVLWGSDFICFYNDAVIPSLDVERHPAIGKPAKDVWVEGWSFIGRLLEEVITTGEPATFQDQPVLTHRSGKTGNAYWTFSYSLILNDSGLPGGVLVTCIETIKTVIGEKKLEESLEDLERFKFMADNAQDPFILMREDGTFAYLNQKALEAWGYNEEEVEHMRVPDADPVYQDEAYKQLFVRAQKEAIPQFETLHRRKDGHVFPVEVNVNGITLDGESHLFAVARDITNYKTAEAALRESEVRFRNMIEEAPVAIALTSGHDFIFESINAPMLQIINKKGKVDVLGKKMMEVLPELENQPLYDILLQVLQTGETFRGTEVKADLLKDGVLQCRYFNISYTRIVEASGINSVLHMSVDVTDQVLARRKVEESETRFRLMADAVPNLVWLLNPDGSYKYVNKTTLDFLAITQEQIEASGWVPYVHPDDVNAVSNAVTVAVQNRLTYKMEHRLHHKDGEYRWVLSQAIPAYDGSGGVYAYVGSGIDIHDRKKAEASLKESEARFRSLIEEAPVATCLFVGRDMIVEVANEIMLGYWGKDLSIIGLPLQKAVPELEGQPFLQILDDVFTTGKFYEAKAAKAELEVDGVLGTYYFDFTYKPLRNASEEVYGIMEMAVNVTREVLAKRALEQSEENLRNMILQAPVAICIFRGKEYVIEVANSSMFKFWGKLDREVMHKPLFEAIPEAKNQGYEELLANVLNTGVGFSASEQPVRLPRDGKVETAFINFAYEPIRDENGIVSSIIAMATDVTEQVLARKKIEELVEQRTKQLAEANKALTKANHDLVSSNIDLEQFGYAASHDMQEPLRKIQTFSNFLEREGSDTLSDKGKMLVTKIGSSAQRMKTIIDDLLKYSNQNSQDYKFDAVNLNDIAIQVQSDLELIIEQNNVQINVDKLPTIPAIPSQINQLFYNLINNSIKFAKKDVAAKIEISSRALSTAEVEERKSLPTDKDYIQISFADNGIGFEPEYAEKIFQLFTRLHGKNEYEGTGIGLGLCKKIVERHDGDIYAVSIKGNGATFNVILPAN